MTVQQKTIFTSTTIQPLEPKTKGLSNGIYTKTKNKNGTSHWRAVVRIKGYPTVCNHFDRKQEADDWAADVESQIKLGKFKFDQHKQQRTFAQLIERYVNDGALEHIRSAEDVTSPP